MLKSKIRYLVPLLCAFIFSSCKKDVDANNIWGVKQDKEIYFIITINGKTLTSYGAKFSVPAYQDMIFDFLYASTSTFTGSNQTVKTETDLVVDPLYNQLFGWGQYGLPDGQVEADISLSKDGTILGIHKIDNTFLGNYIVDKTSGNIDYDVIPTGSSVTITEANEKIVKGTFTLNLKLGSQTTPATGSFRLWKTN